MRRLAALVALATLGAGACAGPDPRPVASGRPPARVIRESPLVATDKLRAVLTPKGVIAPVEAMTSQGLWVRTPCGNLSQIERGVPVARPDVVLDPGHGGAGEPGAVGPNGLEESTLNLAVARMTQRALAGAGVAAVLTRSGDYMETLATRAELAVRLDAKAFVSIHHNADAEGPFPRPGTETYYQARSADSKRLAGLIYEEVERALARYSLPWVAVADAGVKYRLNQRGIDYYGVLRRTAGIPAALVESAYLTNPPEAVLLSRADVQQVEATAIARGIVRYLRSADPGSGYVTPLPFHAEAGGGGGPEGCTDPAL